MRVLSVLLLLACATFAPAQSVKLPEIVAGEPATFLQVSAKTDCASLKWFTPDPGLAIFPTDLLKSTLTAVVTSAKPGKYRLYAYGAKDGQASDVALCVIVIGEPPAPPVPPDPPKPPEPPTPPTPPAPIPLPGLRVLILYESADLAKLPSGQLAAMHSATVRAYLDAKCVKGADGKTAEWRVWDADVDASGDAPHWRAALKLPRQALPWLIVSDGKAGFAGPLPKTTADLLSLLKKYGGE